MIDDRIIEYYRTAGKIAKKALYFGKEYVSPKKKIDLYELCEKIENLILKERAKLAFPCNVSLNDVAAHYSPLSKHIIEFDRGILKIDVGAMVNGYIADTALSVARGYEYETMSKINRDILEEVLHLFKPGVRLGEIGKYIEERALEDGYRPISNLSGHKVEQYNLHAGKSVPNVKELISPKVLAGEVYAVEPFLTFKDNKGVVEGGDVVTIYSLKRIKRIKGDKKLDRFKNTIFNSSKQLPFSPRWFYKLINKETVMKYISKLYSIGYLRSYPILIEKSNGVVSQFEHTVIVLEDDIIITTL